jgi:hypothetical protein
MKKVQKRNREYPRKVEANFGGGMVCKRPAYSTAYCLLTSAYMPAYRAAYLPSTGRAGSRVNTPIRLALWVEKIDRHNASSWFSQN